MYVQRKIAARSCTHCCSGKTVIFWVCVCSLQYPVRSALAPYCHLWPVWLHSVFPHYLINGMIFQKRYGIWNVFWFYLQLLSETFLTLTIQQDMYISLHVKYSLFLSDVKVMSVYSKKFLKMYQYKILWKSVQWEPNCSMRTDWQTDAETDMTKLIVTFRYFAKAPKNGTCLTISL